VVLPVIGALIFILSLFCGFSFGQIIVGIIMVVIACLGIKLDISTRHFNETVEDFEDEPMACDTEAD
jgi:predicted membrane protein